jgi:two-component system, OmpR family, sensor kinase
MHNSLRWRLQAWHALILLMVVAGSGTAFTLEARRARFDEIDAELLAAARVLEGVLRTRPTTAAAREGPSGPAPPRPPRGRPGRGGLPPASGPGRRFGDRPHPPPPPPPPGEGGPRDDRPPRASPLRPGAADPPGDLGPRRQPLSLPWSFRDRHEAEGQAPYFVVRAADGTVIRADPDDGPLPPDDEGIGVEWEYRFRSRGALREVTLLGPSSARILVGRPIYRELGGLRRMLWQVALTGAGVFAAGLFGGWWLSARAVQPIAAMSATVAGITAERLSDRIDLRGVDAELASLGSLINTMLGRLETSFDQQARFTADASHELRTPLSVVLANLELALARPRTAESYRETLQTCRRAAQRMAALVDDLLTLARADAGELELRREPFDLGAAAASCVGLLGALADRKGVQLSVAAPESGAPVFGDPERLGRVVTNLVANAVVYNHPGGRVLVTVGVEEDEAVLAVSDTGVGIADEHLPHVFERFYRVDPARSREPGGSGLGLAICKGVVDAHGGTIAVTSAVGRGTTFTVRLPRGPAIVVRRAAASPSASAPPARTDP